MWTKQELADFYKVSVQAVDHWIRRGCPTIKRGNRVYFLQGEVSYWREQSGNFPNDRRDYGMAQVALMAIRLMTICDITHKDCLAALKAAGLSAAAAKTALSNIHVVQWEVVQQMWKVPNEADPGRPRYKMGEDEGNDEESQSNEQRSPTIWK
jgi:phage terminase Nu1 subunit (DNA packaging protein)